MTPHPPISSTSHTYTVGRSQGVIYPPSVGPAPSAPQLAALYDAAAARIARLERELLEARAIAEDLLEKNAKQAVEIVRLKQSTQC